MNSAGKTWWIKVQLDLTAYFQLKAFRLGGWNSPLHKNLAKISSEEKICLFSNLFLIKTCCLKCFREAESLQKNPTNTQFSDSAIYTPEGLWCKLSMQILAFSIPIIWHMKNRQSSWNWKNLWTRIMVLSQKNFELNFEPKTSSVLPMLLKGFYTTTRTLIHSPDRPMIQVHHLPSRRNPSTSTMTTLLVSKMCCLIHLCALKTR